MVAPWRDSASTSAVERLIISLAILQLLVTAPNGSPMAGQRIHLKAQKYGTVFQYNETIRSNAAGEVLFTIPQVAQDLSSFTIEVRSFH